MIRLRPIRCAILLGPALLLAACGDEAEAPEGDDSRSASGEVLEGTISDDMLAIDKVRSQAPLLQEVEDAAPSDGAAPASAEDEAADAPATEAAPDPEPQPESFDESFSDEG